LNGLRRYFAALLAAAGVSPGLVGVDDGSFVAFTAPVPVGSVFEGSWMSVLLLLPHAVRNTNATTDAQTHTIEVFFIRNLLRSTAFPHRYAKVVPLRTQNIPSLVGEPVWSN
jgi:hypothetical protein